MTITDIQEVVASHLQDAAAKLASADVVAAIQEALAGRYTKDRPLLLLVDLTGDGVKDEWDLADVTDWQNGFSRVVQIEYPQGERSPEFLTDDDWMIYESPAGPFLRFAFAPTNGKKARVKFITPHAADASTAPDADLYALGALAAALAARRLAAIYSQTGDSSIAADTVNYRSKAQEYLALSRKLEKDYENLLGTDAERTAPAASRTSEWKGKTAGGERLTH